MRDPFSWSFPVGRLFGIIIRVHWLFPIVALGLIGRAAKDGLPGSWADATALTFLAFFIVLLHEFGHCFGARHVEGDASEVMLWPLGGLANVEVPHTPKANFITTAAGPAMNLVICAVAVLFYSVLTDFALRPTWNPLWYPLRWEANGTVGLWSWNGDLVLSSQLSSPFLTVLFARIFYLSWLQFLFNVVLIAFPMDGGRMFQCVLWPRLGYHQATTIAIIVGIVVAFVLAVVSFVWNEVLLICLTLFIFQSCYQQYVMLQTGGEEQLFGYDFSQGYTSLERDQPAPAPRRKQPNFIQRWLQKRAQRKQQREQETREAEERRMDELLEKVQRDGLHSLTDEERRFLTRVSARYRNRH